MIMFRFVSWSNKKKTNHQLHQEVLIKKKKYMLYLLSSLYELTRI